MKFLLDTCVASEIARESCPKRVKDAIQEIDERSLYLSVLTIGEIAKGIELLASGKKRTLLLMWLERLQMKFGENLLPVDSEICAIWGAATARLQKGGIILPAVDGLIAATALHYGMHLVTRNTRHVEATGVLIFDPWQK